MITKIKQLAVVTFILLAVVGLFIGLLAIWGVITNDIALDTFAKVAATSGAIFAVSLIVALISKKKE
jgi:hypothetical protein